jgi:acetone carboxylase gamma subunit
VSGERVGDAYILVETGGTRELHCAECGHVFGPASADPKLGAVVGERSLDELSALNRFGTTDELLLREYFCPGCGGLIAANIQRRGDPVMTEMRLS